MSPQEAFLQEIIAHLDDDAPRLIYADWLEEHDQPERAEFIRIQCQRVRSQWPSDVSYRERQLLHAHRSRWMAELPRLPGIKWCDVFERGFLNHVRAENWKGLRTQAERMFAATPVESLYVHQLTPRTCSALAGWPSLTRLRKLILRRLGDAGARELGGSAYLGSLRSLVLRANQIGDAGATALATVTDLANLKALDLCYNQIGDAGAEALAASPHLTNLTDLDLGGNRLSDAGVRAIALSPHLAKLSTLSLCGRIGLAGAQALAESLNLKQIRNLTVAIRSDFLQAKEALEARFGHAVHVWLIR